MLVLSRRVAAATLLFGASIGIAPTLQAQAAQATPSGTTRYYIQSVILKPDMVTEWIDLQKNEVIPAQKKAGVTSRTTLMTQVGEAFEYLVITPFPSWGAMDGPNAIMQALGPEGAARLNAKLRKCVLVQRSYMSLRRDSLSIPPGDALVWRYTIKQVNPGKMNDYLAFYKAEMLPAMQKAKAEGRIAGSSLSTRGVGATSGEFVEVHYHSKFAELDGAGPLVGAMGSDAAAKIGAKAAALATTKEVIVRRRVADLSF
jgi:hypothetical protein